jgi:hypothetical protein
VIAREDDALQLLLLVAPGDEVAPEDLQPALARPDLLPEIRSPVSALRIDRIARAAVVAQVERQERSRWPFQRGGHLHFAVAHREVDQGAVGKREQRLGGLAFEEPRIAVKSVLVDGVADALGKVGLQLGRGHGQAVEEEHQIDAVLVVH